MFRISECVPRIEVLEYLFSDVRFPVISYFSAFEADAASDWARYLSRNPDVAFTQIRIFDREGVQKSLGDWVKGIISADAVNPS